MRTMFYEQTSKLEMSALVMVTTHLGGVRSPWPWHLSYQYVTIQPHALVSTKHLLGSASLLELRWGLWRCEQGLIQAWEASSSPDFKITIKGGDSLLIFLVLSFMVANTQLNHWTVVSQSGWLWQTPDQSRTVWYLLLLLLLFLNFRFFLGLEDPS